MRFAFLRLTYNEIRTTKLRTIEFRITEVRAGEVRVGEVRVGEVRPFEVRLYFKILFPTLIPRHYPLLKYRQMFIVSHTSPQFSAVFHRRMK